MSKSRDTIAKATFEVVATSWFEPSRMVPKYGPSLLPPLRTRTFLLEAQNEIKI